MPRFTVLAEEPTSHPQSSPCCFTAPSGCDDDDDINTPPSCLRLTPAVTTYLAASTPHSTCSYDSISIESLFNQLEERERQRIQAIQDSFRTTQASLQRADLAQHSKQVETRDAHLDGIKRAHEQARAANQAAAREAAAREQQAKEAAVREQQAREAAAAKEAAASKEAAAAKEAALKAASDAQIAAKEQALAAPPSLTPEQRQLKKRLTLYVQQISATQEQVASRTQAILTLLAQAPTPADRELASSLLADRLIAQAEAQVVRLNSFAFPLAMVAVAIACYHEQFAHVLVAKLMAKCPLIEGGRSDTHRQQDDDEHYDRVRGYFLFYGAFCSIEAPGHPHGLPHAWRWLARTLNSGHYAQRGVAVAVEAMLSVAGYRLGQTYGRQWGKLMAFVGGVVVPGVGDAAAVRGVRTRLQVYVEQGAWQRVPRGAVLPVGDDSSYERA